MNNIGTWITFSFLLLPNNNKNSKKSNPCAYVIYFCLIIYLFWDSCFVSYIT